MGIFSSDEQDFISIMEIDKAYEKGYNNAVANYDLSTALHDLYKNETRTCEFDCHNCNFGIMKGPGDNYSCSIEFVEDQYNLIKDRLNRMRNY